MEVRCVCGESRAVDGVFFEVVERSKDWELYRWCGCRRVLLGRFTGSNIAVEFGELVAHGEGKDAHFHHVTSPWLRPKVA